MATLKHVDFEVPGFGEFASPALPVSSYAQAVNALGPLAYWRLNEQSGTTLADQVGSHPLTLSGGYTFGEDGALASHRDDAIRFGSGSGTASGPVLPTTASAAFSVAFWVRTTGTTTTWRSIAQQYEKNTAGNMRIVYRFNGYLRFQTVGEAVLDTTLAVSTDWAMAVLTRDALGGVSWYFNGGLDNQGAGYTSAIDNTAFDLAPYRTDQPDLVLDEVAVFDDALSAEQVQSLYELGTGYFFPPSSP